MDELSELRATYSRLSDHELCRLEGAFETLTIDAQSALRAEMDSRGLKSERLSLIRTEIKAIDREVALDTGPVSIVAPHGIGKMFLGKKQRVSTSSGEEYTANLWVMYFWLPIFPLAAYRLRRSSSNEADPVVIDKFPRDWWLAIETLTKTALIVLVALCVLKFLGDNVLYRPWF